MVVNMSELEVVFAMLGWLLFLLIGYLIGGGCE